MASHDIQGRPYAKLSQLSIGDYVIVDGDFEGCFIAWSERRVIIFDGELALLHNVPECGACGGDESDFCPHTLVGQLGADGDTLIGIYRKEDFHA